MKQNDIYLLLWMLKIRNTALHVKEFLLSLLLCKYFLSPVDSHAKESLRLAPLISPVAQGVIDPDQ